jgi:hypothetical protein
MTDMYYKAKQKPELAEFGTQHYFTAEGRGAPESEQFAAAVQSLYQRAYAARKTAAVKFTVGKLEGLWWAKDNDRSPRDEWNWKLLIRMPEAFAGTEPMDEGLVLQMLHIGPFAAEPGTLDQMHAYMSQHGLAHNGKHHEVYLTDPRRTPPEKTRAILRQPVKRV